MDVRRERERETESRETTRMASPNLASLLLFFTHFFLQLRHELSTGVQRLQLFLLAICEEPELFQTHVVNARLVVRGIFDQAVANSGLRRAMHERQ